MQFKKSRPFTSMLLVGFSLLGFINSVFATTSSGDEAYVIWQHQPLSIRLPVGETRSLIFPNTVQFGFSPELQQQLIVKNNAGVLELKALTGFSNQRVEVRDDVTHEQILLTLSASAGESTAPLAILYNKPENRENQSQSGWLQVPHALQGEMAYLTLTRYAEQQLYAPKRLLTNPYNIQLINSFVDGKGSVPQSNWFNNLFLDNSTINIPWAEWYGGSLYITAVMVRNQLSAPLDLTNNITNICGRENQIWKSVTFFPSWKLSPAGNVHDTTVAFLISTQPFEQAVKQCEAE